jgi:hypothetical protein
MRQTHKGKATLQHQTPRSAGAQPHKKREGGGVGCRNGGGGAFTWEGVWKAGTEGKEEIGVEDPTRFKSAAAHARAYQHLSTSAHTQERQTASIRPAPNDHRSSPGHLYLQAVQTHPLTHTFGRNATLVHTRGAIIISKATYI